MIISLRNYMFELSDVLVGVYKTNGQTKVDNLTVEEAKPLTLDTFFTSFFYIVILPLIHCSPVPSTPNDSESRLYLDCLDLRHLKLAMNE